MAGRGPPLRPRGAADSGNTTGFEHHAGQGESRHYRKHADGVRAGDRPRCSHRVVLRGGKFRAQHHDAADGFRTCWIRFRFWRESRATSNPNAFAGSRRIASAPEGFVEQSLAMATALVPEIGYEKAAGIAKEAYASGRTVRAVAREKKRHRRSSAAGASGPRAASRIIIGIRCTLLAGVEPAK